MAILFLRYEGSLMKEKIINLFHKLLLNGSSQQSEYLEKKCAKNYDDFFFKGWYTNNSAR